MKLISNSSGIAILGRFLLVALLAGGSMFTLSACEKQGPMEKAGENMDEGMEEAGDAADEAGDSMEETFE